MSESDKRRIQVGSRVQCEQFIGTVRYMGSVANSSGEWIGVEWDDRHRGKHDGSVHAIRYFNTKNAKSGSFVRPNAVRVGIAFMDALRERYADIFSVSRDLLNLPQNKGTKRSIELIGFDKLSKEQRNFEHLIDVNLTQMKISFCDDDCHEIKSALNSTKTLNLSKNLLNSWIEIANIVKNMPALTNLILSYNKLELPAIGDVSIESFESLKSLIIDNIEYDWSSIELCATLMWPNIERLEVWANQITVINEIKSPLFDELQHLSLSHNNIIWWHEICKLGYLPKLHTLHISNCEINEIRFECTDNVSKTSFFKELRHLMLDCNKLSNWRDIAELNKLSKLEDLFIKNNPVFDNEKYDINFNLILARIGNLKILNREQVTDLIRKEAEIYYLRRIYQHFIDISKVNGDQNLLQDFLCDNPRFKDILLKCGSPSEDNYDPKVEMKRKYLNVVIQSPFNCDEKIVKKIPAVISILNLKAIIRRMFNIDFSHNIELIWTSKNFECPLDKESQNLNYYSVENEDIILVKLN